MSVHQHDFRLPPSPAADEADDQRRRCACGHRPSGIHFQVIGQARPQGSTRAFIKGGRPVITTDTKGLHEWRDAIAWEARQARRERPMLVGAVSVTATFAIARPKAHLRADGEPKTSAPEHPAKRPDIDKLARAALDALTGVLFADDALVVHLDVWKAYADDVDPGVTIHVREEA